MQAKKVCRYQRKMWRTFLPIIAAPFPGKVTIIRGLKKLHESPRLVSGATKQNSFTTRLWELGGPIGSQISDQWIWGPKVVLTSHNPGPWKGF